MTLVPQAIMSNVKLRSTRPLHVPPSTAGLMIRMMMMTLIMTMIRMMMMTLIMVMIRTMMIIPTMKMTLIVMMIRTLMMSLIMMMISDIPYTSSTTRAPHAALKAKNGFQS